MMASDKNIYRMRLSALRTLMEKKKIDALIVPVTDPHLGEYVPEHWRVIAWLTGFTGSAATVVVTHDFAGLWTDSRYFIQAEEQLAGSGFELVRLRIPHTPEYIEWLAANIKKGTRIAVDGRVISIGQVRLLEQTVTRKEAKLVINADLISALWDDRPPMPPDKAFEHPLEFAGRSRNEKIADVRAEMIKEELDVQLLTSVDDIMWLLNIRGSDVNYSPLIISFAIITHDQVLFFADEEKIPAEIKAAFDMDNVVILPYDSLTQVLGSLPDSSTILVTTAATSAAIYRSLPHTAVIREGVSIPTRLKAVKNNVEIKNLKDVMIKDGVALTRFFYWLEHNLGRVTELSASAKLEAFRMEQEGCVGSSFKAIAACNAHAALPHYSPTEESDTMINAEGIFLLDSGGQYFGGTTDTTRTIALSPPDPRAKSDFTLALKGTIDLSMVRFPYGTKGYQIEVLARKPLWDNGMNYGHGTGHGVGYFLNVHEGPQSIGSGASGDIKTFIEPGMVTSNEPAFYRPGEYGFRTENLVLCVEDIQTESGLFLRFETLTLAYIDKSLIDLSLLDEKELSWLNEYHSKVYDKLRHYLNDEERRWLKDKTSELKR